MPPIRWGGPFGADRHAGAFVVEEDSDRPEPVPRRVEFEDPPNDGGLALVDDPLHAESLPILRDNGNVVIAEHPPARDVARLRLAEHRVGGPLPGLLALHFGGEVLYREDDLVGRRAERNLTPSALRLEDAHARPEELLENVRGLDLLAPDAVAVGTRRTPNGGRGFSAFRRRMRPGRRSNSAPDTASSVITHSSATAHPFASAKARWCSTWRATDFSSSATPVCSVLLRA